MASYRGQANSRWAGGPGESMWESLSSLGSTLLDKLPLVDVLLARSKARQEHDRARFKEIDEMLPEATVHCYIDDAINHEFRDDNRPSEVDQYLEWTLLSGSQFMIGRLNRSRKAFDRSLNKLRNFCALNFFPDHTGNRLLFRPDQNPRWSSPSQNDLRYFRECEGELDENARRSSLAYRAFRRLVKKTLYV